MMTEMEIALLAALVRLIDGYITPLQTRIKCWKTKRYSTGTEVQNNEFEIGMTNPQFDGSTDIFYWFVPIKYWEQFKVIELDQAPKSELNEDEQIIRGLYHL